MLANAQPKPRRQASVKARNKREEARIKRVVRALCVARDGYCRYRKDALDVVQDGRYFWCLSECEGPSQWAHLGQWKRYKTRGQEPEARHATMGSCQLCLRHHELYDRGHLTVRFLSELGADGPLAWERK